MPPVHSQPDQRRTDDEGRRRADQTMKPPKLSIGLPVYNGENFLAQAVDSILAQDFRDFELIISDNASTDRTAEISRRYAESDPRVRYVRLETNQGASRNFTNAFELAR